MKAVLEICVDSVESAITAESAGADRIELCAALAEGGITPSAGTIASVRYNLSIAVNVLIRPRAGDFLYSDLEYDVMRRDIEICGENGADGVVLGILRAGGTVDTERCAHLIEFARPMNVTFHRAFDMCSDPINGLEDIIKTGAARILTSGQKNTAEEGAELIAKLIEAAGDRIVIMPGAGLTSANIEALAHRTGAMEFHMTGRMPVESDMIFRRQGISMGGLKEVPEFTRKAADATLIRTVRTILDRLPG